MLLMRACANQLVCAARVGDTVPTAGAERKINNIGPGSTRCGVDLKQMGELVKQGRPEGMLSHPFQALGCVRLAAGTLLSLPILTCYTLAIFSLAILASAAMVT